MIEAGDYFSVTRGFEFGKVSSISGLFHIPAQDDNKPSYDRSHEGMVYLAMESCFPMVAAKCVYVDNNHSYKSDCLGKVISLNTSEIETMVLSKKYLESLGIQNVAVKAGEQ